MKTILSIIGAIGSGKDTAAKYLSEKLSIPAFEISKPIKDFVIGQGLEPTRENLTVLGSKLVKENGPEFLPKALIDKTSQDLIIITGIRVPKIIKYLRENHNLILLAITAEPEVRFQRSIVRNKLGEAKTFEEFIKNEKVENSPPNAQRLFECMKLADYTISNDADLETFFRKIDDFLKLKKLAS